MKFILSLSLSHNIQYTQYTVSVLSLSVSVLVRVRMRQSEVGEMT